MGAREARAKIPYHRPSHPEKNSGGVDFPMEVCNLKSRRALLQGMACVALGALAFPALPAAALSGQAASHAARPVGTIKSISGNNIALTTDHSGDVNAGGEEAAKPVREEPGPK